MESHFIAFLNFSYADLHSRKFKFVHHLKQVLIVVKFVGIKRNHNSTRQVITFF